MSNVLSLDLRVRILAAVAGGMSHRAAGERFDVSAANVSRWRTRAREQGNARPKALGGDRKSDLIDAYKNTVFAALGPDRDPMIEDTRQRSQPRALFSASATALQIITRSISSSVTASCRRS